MNKRALAVGLVAAILGVVLLEVYKARFEAETSGGPKVPVLIAVEDVPMGAVLKDAVLGVRELPSAYLESRHVKQGDLPKVRGTKTRSALRAGETLLWSDLSALHVDPRDLSELVREGMRAASIRADSFDGLLRPGDRVDVLFTGLEDGEDESTVTLLQNLLVLAVGGRMDASDAQTGIRDANVTVSVTLEQGHVLAQAGRHGSLTLTLRNPDDVVVIDGTPKVARADITTSERRKQWQLDAKAARTIDHVR